MNEAPATSPEARVPLRWWLVWLAGLLLSATLPALHYTLGLDELFENFREPSLLPANLLMMKWLRDFAGGSFGLHLFAGIIAWRTPAQARFWIILALLIALLANTLAAALGTAHVWGILRRHLMEQQQALHQKSP